MHVVCMRIIYTVHTPPPVSTPWGPAPCGMPRVCTLVPFIYSEAMVITDATVAISNSVATQYWMIRLFQNMPRGWTLLNRGWTILNSYHHEFYQERINQIRACNSHSRTWCRRNPWVVAKNNRRFCGFLSM